VGFGVANNQGIRNSSGDFVLLLNADVVLEQQFLAVLVKLIQQNQRAGLAAGKLLNYDERTRLDSTGLIISKNRRAYDRGQGDLDTGQYDQEGEVFGVSGAACLCRRTMLEDIRYDGEYFDELFFVYKEDVELSWRTRLFGWTCVYSPKALGWHHRKWGLGKRQDIPRQVRRHSLKNRYLMLLKNDRWQHILPAILPLFVFEFGSLAYILLREPYLFQAFIDVMRLWPDIIKKRRYIQHIARQRQQQNHLLRWFE
jgi:GT2 family glycosyltransferase